MKELAYGFKYVKGDATVPKGPGNKIIVHICNDLGKWGKGFVMAISKRWKAPEKIYREAFGAEGAPPTLGEVQFVEVGEGIIVANLIGQHGIRRKNSSPPIRYPAIEKGLKSIAVYAKEHNASIHMPRIGCGLAGGSWDRIEPLVLAVLGDFDVTVYDF